jgi:hypothetical protein
MARVQPSLMFSAQGIAFRALQQMYYRLRKGDLEPYEYLPIVVFAAFSIEAYVNSIGSRKITFWDQIERLSWRQKIEILHSNASRDPNWGAEPLQFATQVFTVRDRLAHGKPEFVLGPVCKDQEEANNVMNTDSIKPKWFADISKEWMFASNARA